jgi:small-conductance mechanosensitive channel
MLAPAAALAWALSVMVAPEALALGKSPPPTPTQPSPSAPAATPAPQPATAPAPRSPVAGAIPAPDIPLEADRLLTLLRSLEERVALTPTVMAIQDELPSMAQRIADAQIETKAQVASASSLTVLTNLADLWAGTQGDLKIWADHLRVRATDVGSIMDQLQDLADTWTRTREEAQRTQAPPALIQRIDEALAAIADVRKSAVARRTQLLTLQVKVGEQLAVAQEAATKVAEATTADFNTLLVPDRPPIWRAWRDAAPLTDLRAMVRDSATPQLDVLARFVRDRAKPGVGHVVTFLILVGFALAARRRAREWMAAGSNDPVLRVLDLPVSTALIVGLMLSDWFYVRQPMIAVNLIGIAVLLPVVRILRQVTLPAPATALWVAAAFFLVNRLRDLALLNTPVVEQEVVLLLSAGGAAALVWLWRQGRLSVGSYRVPDALAWLGVAMLVVAFLFGVFGYMRLARLLAGGVLRSVYTALGLFAGWVVALGVFSYLLRVPPLVRLHMVSRYRTLFERRAATLLWWGAVVIWVSATLEWFSLLDEAKGLLTTVLGSHATRGFVSISLGDVVGLVVTVWAAFMLSRFIRFALEEDVYPRLPMGRGLPYAISSLLHYTILLMAFLVAVGAMGVELNKLTLLTGAFGVGVGFGLQTIVNNFVSGIILLLERPIQVGDAIQMGDLDGEVRRIGIRSTTVHTWRGAEVLVPNATLISGNLTNWTLSDRTRRLELPIGVAYGTDPERVIKVLGEAASTVPGVLGQPAPLVLFQGFGDSALNFELRAWTDHFEEWGSIRSNLAVAVNNRLVAESIEIPFPQRDVNVRYTHPEEP